MKIVKLGGSIITDKGKLGKYNETNAKKLADAIFDNKDQLILIHGAGSFGHIKAMKYGLNYPGQIKGKEEAISEVMGDVLSLDSMLVQTLNSKGISAISVPPHSIYPLSNSSFKILANIIERGFVPILYGDIVFSRDEYRIISGDEIVLDLSREFTPEIVVFVTDVDGLYTSDPKTSTKAKLIESADAYKINARAKSKDATGSMKGKVSRIREILNYTRKVMIVNGNHPERLGKVLADEDTLGTVIT